MITMNLTPFLDEHAGEIASWPLTRDEATAWAGDNTPFPVTAEHVRSWSDDSDVHAYVASDEDGLFAYGELWVEPNEIGIELARIIVRPAARNDWKGRRFVAALVEKGSLFQRTEFSIRVLDHNEAAIRCYDAAGFERVSKEDETRLNQGQPHRYVWLKKQLT